MSSNFIHKAGYEPKKENPNDFFPTPYNVCQKAIKDLLPDLSLQHGIRVIDSGAGTGRWGKALREVYPTVNLIGVDLPNINYAVPTPYNTWIEKDYRLLTIEDVGGTVDLIIGNPPYSTTMGVRDLHLAEKFVEKSFELLKPRGTLLYFVRLDFLSGAHRQSEFWRRFPPVVVNVIAERMNFFPEMNSSQTHNHCIIEWCNEKRELYDFSPILNFWSTRT